MQIYKCLRFKFVIISDQAVIAQLLRAVLLKSMTVLYLLFDFFYSGIRYVSSFAFVNQLRFHISRD